MKYVRSQYVRPSFAGALFVGYCALILLAGVSIISDGARAYALVERTVEASQPTEIADLGAMTVTAYRGHGAHAYEGR